jgi:hypothetical protein
MPRGDGSGPAGMGPMTGRAAGYCAGYASPGFASGFGGYWGGRGWRGMGRGRGMGFRGMPFYAGATPGWAGYAPAVPFVAGQGYPVAGAQGFDEKTVLKNQEQMLEDQLKQIKERLKTLDQPE